MSTVMRAAQFTPGGPENIYISSEVPIPPVKANQVLLKVYATAINRAECLQRRGLYPALPGGTDILGLEATGTVDKLGEGCSGKWKLGDRVMALLPGGGNAEYVNVDERHLMRVPDDMPFLTAAAIPEVWLTAYQILHFVGGLRSDDRVLIHAGGSGVGTAAVQLVKLHNASSLVTAGSQVKLDKAKQLGAMDGFNYKEGPWAEKVKNATKAAGASLVLDCVGGSYWQQNTDALAMEGRWVIYGGLGGLNVEGDLLAKILRKRLSLIGSTLKTRSPEYKADLIASFAEKALPHFSSGGLQTIVDQVLPLEDLAKAHAVMESNKNTGKIVIKVRDEQNTRSDGEL